MGLGLRIWRPFLAVLAAGWISGFGGPLKAQTTAVSPFVAAGEPSPEQDDSTLNDVFFLGPRFGWAVGDRGTVWRSRDGGETWQFVRVPTQESLRSVTFINPQVGWIAGGGTRPYTQHRFGVLLRTTDGGESWTQIATGPLPGLRSVQFLNSQNGFAVGDSNITFANGLLATSDSGRTWRPVIGPVTADWTVGAFFENGNAVVAGRRGALATMSAGGFNPVRTTSQLKAFHAMAVDPASTVVWLVGDGGLVLRSADQGRSWSSVGETLPRESALIFNFEAVTADEGHVWVAGSPGSRIWHSGDGGATWSAQPTPETTPIQSLCVVGGGRLAAAGALGKILLSDNAGRTWRTVRGGGRRLAALALHSGVERMSFLELARDASELGYRTGAWILVRPDLRGRTREADQLDRRFEDAALAAGASVTQIEWRLPVTIPGLDRNRKSLQSEWSILTDQHLDDILTAVIATQLATWQPSVVLLDDPPADDVPTPLLQAGLARAIDPEFDIEHRFQRLWQTAGLRPQRPDCIFSRRPTGSDGVPAIDPFEWAPHRGASLATVAAEAASRMTDSLTPVGERDAWHEVQFDRGGIAREASEASQEFFQKIPLAMDGAARRALPPLDADQQDQMRLSAQKQREFFGFARAMLDRPGASEQLLARLNELVDHLSDGQAALQLATLAAEHRRRGQWDAAEATLMELVTRYPREPAAQAAMRWLLTFWGSSEIDWQRSRGLSVVRSRVDQAVAQGIDPQLVRPVEGHVMVGDLQSVISAAGRAIDEDVAPGQAIGRRQLNARKRSLQAERVLELLGQVAPEELADPSVQLGLAACLRRDGRNRDADVIISEMASGLHGSWSRLAQGEVWLRQPAAQPPQSRYLARKADSPPVLDGLLSDPCWQLCAELRLRRDEPGSFGSKPSSDAEASDDVGRTSAGFCFLAYDARYLYLAASAPRQSGLPADGAQYAGRPYDADLQPYDRFSIALDVNRDYASFYRFDIDQRGWTRDACWEDQGWNPRWHVACDAGETHWRIEAAIPWEELVPAAPASGDAWALGVMRTMPGIGRQSWLWPATDDFRPESFGLLQFE